MRSAARRRTNDKPPSGGFVRLEAASSALYVSDTAARTAVSGRRLQPALKVRLHQPRRGIGILRGDGCHQRPVFGQ